MIGRFFSLIFFIFIGYIILKLLKLIFQIGKTTGEFNRRVDEMNRSKKPSSGEKKGDVIELDKDQYKVE
ncbi:MAG TPA: hypothetical protein PKG60_11195 [Spirochaetota bacterium]|nr:hypothetical protein [Spirochaetota bacterium]HPS86426.1 hypothetical protein [Spirochaetota bacterium]